MDSRGLERSSQEIATACRRRDWLPKASFQFGKDVGKARKHLEYSTPWMDYSLSLRCETNWLQSPYIGIRDLIGQRSAGNLPPGSSLVHAPPDQPGLSGVLHWVSGAAVPERKMLNKTQLKAHRVQ